MHRSPSRRGKPPGLSPRQMVLLGTAAACVFFLLVILGYLVWERANAREIQVLDAPRTMLYEGGVPVERVHLTDVSMQQNGQALAMQLRFQGYDGMDRAVAITSIPRVTIYGLKQPARIAIKLPNLAAWEDSSALDLSGQTFVQGVFLHDQTLYLQLNFYASLALEGQGGVLKLTLTRMGTAPAWPSGHRVVADVADRIGYTALTGTLSGMGMTPVLSADGNAVLMISPVYGRQRAAQAFAGQVAAVCKHAESKATPQVIPLEAGALPTVQALHAADFMPAKAKLLMRDAQILDHAAESGRMLVKRADGAVLVLEESGKRRPLFLERLPETLAGALSHDGGIGALSTADGQILLHQKGDTTAVAGLGGPTRTLAWTRENLLYFMNGDPLGFYWVDPSQAMDAEVTPQRADQYGGLEGRLIGRRHALYLQGEEQNIVYRCNPADASRSTCALGYRFDVSQDGSALAVQTDRGAGTGLKLVNLNAVDDEQLIGLGLDLYDFCLSYDGQRAYYLDREAEGYALYRYDRASGATQRMMKLPACTLYATAQAGTLLLNVQKDGVWWVYRLALDA